MPQPVHLQYNSPMGLYSKEAAVEQFEQQIGETPSDLPAPEKHFDPSKSATLKYLREGGDDTFGENFFEKVAQAEAPRVPQQTEPAWARTAREKSERARSKTPADPAAYRPASSPAPACHPVHYENAREHAEKNRVFTHNIHEPYGRSYYDAAMGLQRNRRSHSAGRELSNRGYDLGGLDYTQGIHVDHGTDYQYYQEPPRKPEAPKLPPGYEMGGTDFYQGHQAGNANYRGHGPDPPRLRPKYTADPHDPCNVAMAPNLDAVNGNLLVGDTLSNQKIRHEVRNIDQTQFGTSFAPPQGFKRDHVTVHRAPEPAQPTVYSLSANKSLARSASLPRSSAPPEQHNVWNSQQYETYKEVSIRTLLNDEALRAPKRETSPYWANRSEEKHHAWQGRRDPRLERYETYITEPNWRRSVDQRRLAWERRAFETEQRLSRPYSEKVAPGVPPAWHAEAQHKHQQWQQQADNMSSSNYNQNISHYSQPQQYTESRHYTTSTSSYPGQQQQQQQQHQQQYQSNVYDSQHSNAQQLLNTGYNTNQVDYVLSHKDKYAEGPHYQPPIINSSQANNNSSTFNRSEYSTTQPVGGSYQSNQYNTTTTTTRSVPVQQTNLRARNVHFLPVFRPSTEFFEDKECFLKHSEQFHRDFTSPLSRTVPVQVVSKRREMSEEEEHRELRSQSVPVTTTSYQEDHSEARSERSYANSVAIPLPPPDNYQASNYNKSYSSHTTTTTTNQQPQTVVHHQPSSQNYSSSYHSERTSTNTHQQPQTIALPPPQNYSTSYQTETHSSTGPTMMHSPGGQSYKSTEFSSSRYNKQETTTRTTSSQQQQPTFQTTTLPVTKTTSYNYTQRDVPSEPARPAMHQESYTSHTERNSSNTAPRQQPAGYQYENYLSSRKEESRREETSRPVSQLSQYSESRNYKRNYEEKTETTTIPAHAPTTNVTYKDLSNAQSVDDVFNKRTEMNEQLPVGSVSNTHNNTEGGYRDANGHDVSYKRETQTAADPGREVALLKEEEKRVVETPLEPGVISRHVTTKYYKKKTVTDTTTTTTPA